VQKVDCLEALAVRKPIGIAMLGNSVAQQHEACNRFWMLHIGNQSLVWHSRGWRLAPCSWVDHTATAVSQLRLFLAAALPKPMHHVVSVLLPSN
jgi:hypothetical protein